MTDNPQEPAPQPPGEEFPQSTQSFRKRRPMVLAILGGIGCLLLTLIIVGVIYFFAKSVGKEELQLVNDQLNALRNNDIDRAYSFCSREFQKSTSKEDFIGLVENYPILKNAKEFTSSEGPQKVGVTTVLRGTVTGKDDSKLPAEYQLIRENEKWKIQFLKLSPAGILVEEPSQDDNKEKSEAPAPVPVVSNLQIANVNVSKEKENESVKIIVTFQVMNFVIDKSSGSPKIHIVQDLKTIDPGGNIITDLSKDAINDLRESGEYKSTDFEYKLTIPPTYSPGRYQMVITVHDIVGGMAAATTAQFEIP